MEGRDLGDPAVLADVASQVRLEGDIPAWLASDAGKLEVQEDLAQAARLQISGVPFFIFEGRVALAGAQPPEVFLQALETAAKTPAQPIG
jgi:predicted DsbA family dithiol-disulfide isomerase